MKKIYIVTIIHIVYTIIYSIICKTIWLENETCQRFLMGVIISLSLAFATNFGFIAIIKMEMYEALAGYDKNKTYDKDVLKNYIIKLSFRVALVMFTISLIPIFAPLLSKINPYLSGDFWIIAYMFLVTMCLFLTIFITALKNKI